MFTKSSETGIRRKKNNASIFFSDREGHKKTIGNLDNHEIRASFYSLKCLNVTQPVFDFKRKIYVQFAKSLM